jgi:hypothetical protein
MSITKKRVESAVMLDPLGGFAPYPWSGGIITAT